MAMTACPCSTCAPLRALEAENERLKTALRRIVDTDTHGKNVLDDSGRLRPTGTDFCGRCNRNSFHPHADDCPIVAARAALGEETTK